MGKRRNRFKFRILCDEAREVAKLYFKALQSANMRSGKYNLNMSVYSKAYEGEDINKLYINKIENAFRQLDVDSKRIINNDFFFNNYKFWWLSLYSTATYYRLKRVAICRFLEFLD
ncbi:MAG: hypothetical protein WCX85_02120 [Bacilli bacterium]|jgi:hypothetical protein|nr:hypothetical protein [Bacilli bacterium]